MWKRFSDSLRCVRCGGGLDLQVISGRTANPTAEHRALGDRLGITGDSLTAAVDSGLLSCRNCKVWFPVLHGLPIMLPYTSPLHDEFLASHGNVVRGLGPGFDSMRDTPVVGEEFVLRSFSKEWLEYSFDGVLWTWTYEDREQFFLGEMGREPAPPVPARFLEIGCGLGLVTSFAAKQFPGDAVGVDLSLAALRAAAHFKDHPFVHFVQASLWKLPFERKSFDLLYSHGVLHHTYSTEAAFKAVAAFLKPNGRAYIWLYGIGSLNETVTRRAAYAAESLLRPVLSRLPTAMTSAVLTPIAASYMGFNWLQRLSGRKRQPYNFERAMHAARDRFTPMFAFHHSAEEVERWFHDAGFRDIHLVDEKEVPAGHGEVIRRNVGMRGQRAGD